MSEFSAFLKLGFEHISDLQAYDHLLFIITLCAIYKWTEWKKVLLLVTAFTVGHSITLAFSALDFFNMPSSLVELLIPITIFITALHNVWQKEKKGDKKIYGNYLIALFFGLIHGMGFANYFKSLFGEVGSVVKPLFAFNVGIEIGQIMIVFIFFVFYFLLSKIVSISRREWNVFVSGAGAGVSITLILNQLLG